MRKRHRFPPEFKASVVLDVLTGQMSPAEACRKHALSLNRLSLWKTTFLQRAHAAFQADDHRSDEQACIAELERLVGRLTMEHEILKKPPRSWPRLRRETGGGHEPRRGVPGDYGLLPPGPAPQFVLLLGPLG